MISSSKLSSPYVINMSDSYERNPISDKGLDVAELRDSIYSKLPQTLRVSVYIGDICHINVIENSSFHRVACHVDDDRFYLAAK